MRAAQIKLGFNRLSYLAAVVLALAVASFSWESFLAQEMRVADIYDAIPAGTSKVPDFETDFAIADRQTWPGWAGPIYASPVILLVGFYLVRALGNLLAFSLDRAHREEDYRSFARQFALSVLWLGVYAASAMLLTPNVKPHLLTFLSWAVPLLSAAFLVPFVLLRAVGWIVAGFGSATQ